MKTGIELLPDFKQATVITIDVLAFLVEKKILDIKDVCGMGDELTDIVLKAVQEGNKSWGKVFKKLSAADAPLSLAEKSRLKRARGKIKLGAVVFKICSSNPSYYKKTKLESLAPEIAKLLITDHGYIKPPITTVRDAIREWRRMLL